MTNGSVSSISHAPEYESYTTNRSVQTYLYAQDSTVRCHDFRDSWFMYIAVPLITHSLYLLTSLSYLHSRNIHHDSKSSVMITITGNIPLTWLSFIQGTSFTAPHAAVYVRLDERTRTSWVIKTSLWKVHAYIHINVYFIFNAVLYVEFPSRAMQLFKQ